MSIYRAKLLTYSFSEFYFIGSLILGLFNTSYKSLYSAPWNGRIKVKEELLTRESDILVFCLQYYPVYVKRFETNH